MNKIHTTWLIAGPMILAALFSEARAEEAPTAMTGEWKLQPSTQLKEYIPVLENHFSVDGDILRAKCALGADFYSKLTDNKGAFVGPGPIWVANTTWPSDIGDFEFEFESRWIQDEPGRDFGDFPDTHIGFRLGADGAAGYRVSWGMLGQIRLVRLGNDAGPIGQGYLKMYKKHWVHWRIRAAGPIIKIKIWNAAMPEPVQWSLEAFDDRSAMQGSEHKKGALAAGFWGRRLFDTCIYEWRNFRIKPLTVEEVNTEKFFDGDSAPKKEAGYAGAADLSLVVIPMLTDVPKSADDMRADANLEIKGDTDDGLVIASKDGEPAFLWKKVPANANLLALRMKSTTDSRPLFGVRSGGDSTDLVYLDPIWRDGIVAMLHPSKLHTAGSYQFAWKSDTWHDFVLHRAHWWKWQVIETAESKNRVAFAGRFFDGKGIGELGLGVAGSGTVTIKNMAVLTKK